MAYSFKSITNFMRKNDFGEDEIRYILRCRERTVIHLMDGRRLCTCIPLAYLDSFLGNEKFTRINKSILISNAQVVNVAEGAYLMTDGEILAGRRRSMKEHKEFMQKLAGEQHSEEEDNKLKILKDKFQAFENFPIPFCIIQLVFDAHGESTSFIFRYCNELMARLELLQPDQILNHSFYDVFENPDLKWLVEYGDVAKNGGVKVFRSYKEKLRKELIIICYQIAPGYCGCLVMQEEWLHMLPQKTAVQPSGSGKHSTA